MYLLNRTLHEDQTKTFEFSSISSFSLTILTIFVQLFSMLESDVCASKSIDLLPATGIIGCPFDAMHQFLDNSRFCMGTLELTFDLLHRTVQWLILVLDENWQVYTIQYSISTVYTSFLSPTVTLAIHVCVCRGWLGWGRDELASYPSFNCLFIANYCIGQYGCRVYHTCQPPHILQHSKTTNSCHHPLWNIKFVDQHLIIVAHSP